MRNLPFLILCLISEGYTFHYISMLSGHLGLEAADKMEHAWHSLSHLDSHLHADLVAGCALHATLV